MVGIPLSQQQRSAVLQSLLQQRPRRNPISGIGALGQAGSQIANAFVAKQLLGQQQQQEAQKRQQEEAARSAVFRAVQGQESGPFGVETLPQAAQRFPGSEVSNQVLGGLLQQQLGGGQAEPLEIVEGPQGPQFVPRSQAAGQRPGSRPTARAPKSFFGSLEGKDVRVTERDGQFFVGNRPVSGAEIGPATQKVLQGDLGKSVRDSIQKEIVGQLDVKRDLEAIKEFDPREFLSVTGKLRRFGSEVADRFNFSSEATQEFLQKDVTFRQNTEALFFKIRKEITGAQAAVQELESLKESVLSTKLTPAQFEASRNLYLQRVEDAIALRQQLLRQGLTPGTEDFGAAFDTQFGGGLNQGNVVNFEDLPQ